MKSYLTSQQSHNVTILVLLLLLKKHRTVSSKTNGQVPKVAFFSHRVEISSAHPYPVPLILLDSQRKEHVPDSLVAKQGAVSHTGYVGT